MRSDDSVPHISDRPLLEIRDLNLDFGTPQGRLHALRNISLEVPAAQVVGVVGESGSGKSTLAYAVMGLLSENADVTAGSILFEGEDLLKMPARKRGNLLGDCVSMIFQDPMTALNPVRTVESQMIDVQHHKQKSRGEKRARAIGMLHRVGIPDPQSRISGYPHHFSGGMRQRICIAMALLVNPALLIADEPTTALDATLEVQIIHLLQDLQRELGCSILFVSHHLGAVAELCDRVAVMYAGEVVEQGPVREIFHNPAHPYTRALLECDPGRLKQKTRALPTIPGEVPSLLGSHMGCIFSARCPQVFDRCVQEKPVAYAVGSEQVARCHLLEKQRMVLA
ncbi:ABC transporter ATP-binding protein [Sinorhizobium meliloti]|uniref:ABC transporter ATP-binding protein n=1 Tax=Rhizobium meliloti TaxID=382 RepID=UPI000FD2C38B|nr:ABC transporter ATP-binding protein [Sinorhizobium meliloti]MDW9358603.1 ATP-binding cassette domain-containing protein [Sinorhizobium meliloti]MDW9527067.1 ATP-binding cassette domain-containing protein [Sinorhizobium meliloti]MDW9657949.1 ATP-binding cassette domain-containing protein [Sinorhizobium meliloti]MDW9880760.1 ATP-binding cassette domain-containing protein [Sinorhizobium meliloti]MDW9917860.1 ATP-binding cassette domain-containing protein [Sinorhizobium meliloti]